MADTKDGGGGNGGKAPPRKRPPQPSLVEGGWDDPAVEAEVETAPPKKATTITGGTPLGAGAAGSPAEAAASASAPPRAPGSNPSRGAPVKPEPAGATAPGGSMSSAAGAPPAPPPHPPQKKKILGPNTPNVNGCWEVLGLKKLRAKPENFF